MEVLLDGSMMVNREVLHDLLVEKLELPDYYGRNLDALYDALSECRKDLNIRIIHADMMLAYLGNYGNALLRTLSDASRAFANVDFSVSNEII